MIGVSFIHLRSEWPPNGHLTVRGRRVMPALGLGWYSAAVSDCGCFTSHDAASGLRNASAAPRLMPSPLREREERPPALRLCWIGCALVVFCELQSGLFFACWRALAYRSDSEVFGDGPALGRGSRPIAYIVVVRTALEFPGQLIRRASLLD